jgi:hypothetical protein
MENKMKNTILALMVSLLSWHAQAVTLNDQLLLSNAWCSDGTMDTDDGETIPVVYMDTFSANKSVQSHVFEAGDEDHYGAEIPDAAASGTWQLNGTTLTIRYPDAEVVSQVSAAEDSAGNITLTASAASSGEASTYYACE